MSGSRGDSWTEHWYRRPISLLAMAVGVAVIAAGAAGVAWLQRFSEHFERTRNVADYDEKPALGAKTAQP